MLFALILALAACSESEIEAGTTSRTTLDAESDPGRLAILDEAGNVVVMSRDGSGRLAVTDDAGEGVIYSQPTWSPADDLLVIGQATSGGFGIRIQGPDTGPASVVSVGGLPFYTFWAPNGETIGALHNGADGLDFLMVDVADESARVVGTGSPFYFSWDPAGANVVTHVGENRMGIIDSEGVTTDLGDTDAGYLAPQWTPSGIVHVSAGDLVIQGVGDTPVVIAEVSRFTPFVVNPQGTHVALQTLGDDGAISVALREAAAVAPGRLVVVDIETGDVEVVDAGAAMAFFWSPDGRSLLFLTPSTDLDGVEVNVWTTGGDMVTRAVLTPSIQVLTGLIPFFPQYAQSMSFWSPDSTAFALAGVIDDDEGIWVFDSDGGDPGLIATGSWVSWSR